MSRCELVASIPARNILGESIVWDDRRQRLWWTDIQAARLHLHTPATATSASFELPERLASFGFVEGDDRLICAFASGLAFYRPESARLEWLYRPELGWQGTRFNDGRVDRRGRFWSGTMVEGDARDAAGQAATGSLYMLAADRGQRMLGDIGISNSLCWSLDGSTLYFADSPTRRIMAYPMQRDAPDPGSPRVFAAVAGEGVPDGSTVDADGCLWNAVWGGSRLVRYAPTGAVDIELALPVSQPTCLCFGGEALDRIFVTSATEGLGSEQLDAEPEAGNVLIYRTPYRGVPESRYRPLSQAAGGGPLSRGR